MIAMILLSVAALYVALLVWAVRKRKTWLGRGAVSLLLLSPVIYIVGSYKYAHYRHEQVCAREGGLKVLIQPELTDRIRLDADAFGRDRYAFGYLSEYFPRLAVVEAWDGVYTEKVRKIGYFAYSPDPTTTALPKKDWKFIKTPLNEPTPGLFVLKTLNTAGSDFDKFQWRLERGGQTYATWTSFNHFWSRNGAMNIGWQCFGPSSKEWMKSGPMETLINLILK